MKPKPLWTRYPHSSDARVEMKNGGVASVMRLRLMIGLIEHPDFTAEGRAVIEENYGYQAFVADLRTVLAATERAMAAGDEFLRDIELHGAVEDFLGGCDWLTEAAKRALDQIERSRPGPTRQ